MHRTHRRTAALASLLAALALLAGCQTGEKLTLDATSRPAKEQVASYSLTVMDPAIEKDSLRHQEAERLVKAALAGNGYYEAPDTAHADMLIKIDYGIDAEHSETFIAPPPFVADPDQDVIGVIGENGQVIEGVNPAYRLGILKNHDLLVKQPIYTKRLVLEARRTKADKPGDAPEDVFIMEVQSEGRNHDLRQTLPVLAAVALDHMGEETDGTKVIKLTDADAIAFVKNPANAR